MTNIYTPKADDTNALATKEYAIEKSSGYLHHNGFGPGALARSLAYVEYNGPRVIVERVVGTTEWTVVEQVAPVETETVIPDALPENFA